MSSELTNLYKFLEFDELSDNKSVLAFQQTINYFFPNVVSEILETLSESSNLDQTQSFLTHKITSSSGFTYSDYSAILPYILRSFGYSQLTYETELDVKQGLREILIWTKDCEWSYNKIWNDFRNSNKDESSIFIEGRDLLRIIKEVIYQSALQKLLSLITTDPSVNQISSELPDESAKNEEEGIEEGYYTRQEVAEILKVSNSTVKNYEKRGLLNPVRLSERQIRYSKTEVHSNLESLKETKFKRISKY